MISRFARKIVLALLLIAVIPLAASLFLIDQVMNAAEGLRAGEAERSKEAVKQAHAAYTELITARKEAIDDHGRALAQRLGALPAGRLDAAILDGELAAASTLKAVRVEASDGALLLERTSTRTFPVADFRERHVREPLTDGRTVDLTYVTPWQLFRDFEKLDELQSGEVGLGILHERLGGVFRAVSFIGLALVMVVATLAGLVLARQVTRRVLMLARATRRVAAGDLDARAHLPGADELADLGRAFDEMVGELQSTRQRVAFLEKIGAWQEIARRLAHEIKNPLTPIQLAVQQLKTAYVPRGAPGEDRYAHTLGEAAEIVAEEIGGLRRLVEEFSAFAKLPHVTPAPVDAALLVSELLRAYSGFDGKVEFTAQPDAPIVLADKLLMRRALHNLIENALQAGARRVWIRIERQPMHPGDSGDDEVEVAAIIVEDDGPGIPAAVAERVFDPYFTTKEHGTGLGLAIVKKIILEHRGEVSLLPRPGGGARFVLTLPIEAAAAATAGS